MASKHACGPEHDTKFFEEIAAVMSRHPDAAKRYQIRCGDHETEIMKLNHETEVCISRIEDRQIITEIVSRGVASGVDTCCSWCWIESDAGSRFICCDYWVSKRINP